MHITNLRKVVHFFSLFQQTSETSLCTLSWVWIVLRINIALTIFQSYHDLEAEDTQYLKFKRQDWESYPRPLAQQAKSLTTTPLLLPLNLQSVITKYNKPCPWYCKYHNINNTIMAIKIIITRCKNMPKHFCTVLYIQLIYMQVIKPFYWTKVTMTLLLTQIHWNAFGTLLDIIYQDNKYVHDTSSAQSFTTTEVTVLTSKFREN